MAKAKGKVAIFVDFKDAFDKAGHVRLVHKCGEVDADL